MDFWLISLLLAGARRDKRKEKDFSLKNLTLDYAKLFFIRAHSTGKV